MIAEDAVSLWGHVRAAGERRAEQGKDAGRPNGSAIWPSEDAALRSVPDAARRARVSPKGHQIGYPPARVWGSPTTAMWASRLGPMRAKRLLLTGDSLTGAEAAEWGLATEAAPAAELDARFERLLERVARTPVNQLVMMKLLVNQTVHAQGLAQTQVLGTFFDGIARHTEEGHGFVRRAAQDGFREAVRERDEPYGDHGLEGFGLD